MNLFGSAFYIFLQRQFFWACRASCSRRHGSTGAARGVCSGASRCPCRSPLLHHRVSCSSSRPAGTTCRPRSSTSTPGSVEEFTAPLGIAYAMTKYSPARGRSGRLPVRHGRFAPGDPADAPHLRLRPAVLRRGRRHPGPQRLIHPPVPKDLSCAHAHSPVSSPAWHPSPFSPRAAEEGDPTRPPTSTSRPPRPEPSPPGASRTPTTWVSRASTSPPASCPTSRDPGCHGLRRPEVHDPHRRRRRARRRADGPPLRHHLRRAGPADAARRVLRGAERRSAAAVVRQRRRRRHVRGCVYAVPQFTNRPRSC